MNIWRQQLSSKKLSELRVMTLTLVFFQPFGGGYSEQDYHVRGSHANSEEAGEIIDRGYAGAASTALYLKLLSLADEVVTCYIH